MSLDSASRLDLTLEILAETSFPLPDRSRSVPQADLHLHHFVALPRCFARETPVFCFSTVSLRAPASALYLDMYELYSVLCSTAIVVWSMEHRVQIGETVLHIRTPYSYSMFSPQWEKGKPLLRTVWSCAIRTTPHQHSRT